MCLTVVNAKEKELGKRSMAWELLWDIERLRKASLRNCSSIHVLGRGNSHCKGPEVGQCLVSLWRVMPLTNGPPCSPVPSHLILTSWWAGPPAGVIRSLHNLGRLGHAFCTETRPYNQGARLTAFELVYEQIPATLIADSMAAAAMAHRGVSGKLGGVPAGSTAGIQGHVVTLTSHSPAVIVGADRVVANGDTANKVGTYQLAIAAKHHGIPFYVAAPSSSCDLRLETGQEIVIEERPGQELTDVNGVRIAAPGKLHPLSGAPLPGAPLCRQR